MPSKDDLLKNPFNRYQGSAKRTINKKTGEVEAVIVGGYESPSTGDERSGIMLSYKDLRREVLNVLFNESIKKNLISSDVNFYNWREILKEIGTATKEDMEQSKVMESINLFTNNRWVNKSIILRKMAREVYQLEINNNMDECEKAFRLEQVIIKYARTRNNRSTLGLKLREILVKHYYGGEMLHQRMRYRDKIRSSYTMKDTVNQNLGLRKLIDDFVSKKFNKQRLERIEIHTGTYRDSGKDLPINVEDDKVVIERRAKRGRLYHQRGMISDKEKKRILDQMKRDKTDQSKSATPITKEDIIRAIRIMIIDYQLDYERYHEANQFKAMLGFRGKANPGKTGVKRADKLLKYLDAIDEPTKQLQFIYAFLNKNAKYKPEISDPNINFDVNSGGKELRSRLKTFLENNYERALNENIYLLDTEKTTSKNPEKPRPNLTRTQGG